MLILGILIGTAVLNDLLTVVDSRVASARLFSDLYRCQASILDLYIRYDEVLCF